MIDVSLNPSTAVKKKSALYYNIVTWLNTLPGVPEGQDASGGKLKAALTSTKPLYVTSYQYLIGRGPNDFTCLNVMVDRKDYRLIIGFDNRIIRVESLDARSARAQTRSEVELEMSRNAAALAGNPAPANNGGGDGDNPYGNNPASNPYGVVIPAPSDDDNPYANNPGANPYGVPILAP